MDQLCLCMMEMCDDKVHSKKNGVRKRKLFVVKEINMAVEGIIHHLIWASILMYVSFCEGTAGFDVSLQESIWRVCYTLKSYFQMSCVHIVACHTLGGSKVIEWREDMWPGKFNPEGGSQQYRGFTGCTMMHSHLVLLTQTPVGTTLLYKTCSGAQHAAEGYLCRRIGKFIRGMYWGWKCRFSRNGLPTCKVQISGS